ncbi:MAG: Fic family protein [Phycisphaeraceae bacterium]|nr:Fic family protein [Phycisphaeraceae bacterium]
MRQPRTPPDLPSIFSGRYKEITHAVVDEAYRRFAQTAQDRYEHWEKLRHRAVAKGLDAELAWAIVKTRRTFNAKPLPLTDKSGNQLTYWLSDAAQHELMMIDRVMAGNVPEQNPQALSIAERSNYIAQSYEKSFAEEAIASSLLEGAATTRVDAKRMLREQREPRNEGEQMVENNYNAMLFIRDQLDTDLSDSFIHELHRIVTHDIMETEKIGRWRRSEEPVVVEDPRDNEVMHEPPPAGDLPKRMKKLYRFANRKPEKTSSFLHPVVQGIALHFQFGYEHPYCDGNGRVARALFYWLVLRSGYWLFEYLPISTILRKAAVRYGRSYLYTEHDGFDLGYFLTYQLEVTARARQELAAYLERQAEKRREADKATDSDPRLNPRQRMLVRRLMNSHNPSIAIATHQKRERVSYPTARSDLMQLESFGYLRSEKAGRKLIFHLNKKN